MSDTQSGPADVGRAELFWDGDRQAVRLPVGVTIAPGVGGDVRVRCDGATLVLEPGSARGAHDGRDDLGWPAGYFAALEAGAAASTIEAPDRPPRFGHAPPGV